MPGGSSTGISRNLPRPAARSAAPSDKLPSNARRQRRVAQHRTPGIEEVLARDRKPP
jgi:hypothetical protein